MKKENQRIHVWWKKSKHNLHLARVELKTLKASIAGKEYAYILIMCLNLLYLFKKCDNIIFFVFYVQVRQVKVILVVRFMMVMMVNTMMRMMNLKLKQRSIQTMITMLRLRLKHQILNLTRMQVVSHKGGHLVGQFLVRL